MDDPAMNVKPGCFVIFKRRCLFKRFSKALLISATTMYRYSPELQLDVDCYRDDMTMDERLHRWIDQELAAELERTVVVSNLPADEDDLLNKLEEYLSKSANCAGYIERIEYLDETSAIIVLFESKVCEDLISFSRANVLEFIGRRLTVETLYEYEQNQEQGSGKVFKGSIFGETTVNVSNEWLPDVHTYFERINEMAVNLGLQSTNTGTGCSFSGNFETLIKLRNNIEWLMFDERGAVVNQEEHMDIEAVGLPDVPLDHTSMTAKPHDDAVSPINLAPTPLDDAVLQSHTQQTVTSNPTEYNDGALNGIDYDFSSMDCDQDCDNKSDNLISGLEFKPELVRYAKRVHSAEIDEIRLTCNVNIRATDNGNVLISLSDSVPGTETDVENAVDLLKRLFSEIDQEMSMQYFDLGRFDVSDDFRAIIQTQLTNNLTILVVSQTESCALQVCGKSECIKDAIRKAEELLVKEVEREMEIKMESERKEKEAMDVERREMERREIERREAERRKAERREAERREAELREAYARELELKAREARRLETLAREEEERKMVLAREAERARFDHQVEAVVVPQTNAVAYAAIEDPLSHDQPLPPPSTGDDWLEPSIAEQPVNENGESSDLIDGKGSSSPTNKAEIIHQEQPKALPDTNGRNDKNERNLPKQREDISPTSTLRPLNPRFHDFLSRNFFQATSGSGQAHMYDTIFNGVHITVRRGDIAKEPAAIIVSSNDVELSCGGALSSTIDKNSGSIIHARCLEWMEAYGTPVEGQIVEIDSEGVLPCSKVFFIVMPTWNAEQDQMYVESQLRQSCKNILQKARDTRNVSSVAIPGLGTGKFYFPCDVYARIMTDALMEFLQAKGRMLEIRFIDLDFRVLQALQREFQNRLKHPENAREYEQSLSEIYRQTTDNGEPLPTGFIERTPPSGFERTFRRQTSDNQDRERKWVKKFRSLSETASETRFESCVLCTRRVTMGFFGYIPCKHIICHLCSKGMELHEKRACPTCFKSFSKLQISKF